MKNKHFIDFFIYLKKQIKYIKIFVLKYKENMHLQKLKFHSF